MNNTSLDLLPQPRNCRGTSGECPFESPIFLAHPETVSDIVVKNRVDQLGGELRAEESLPPHCVLQKGCALPDEEAPDQAQGYLLSVTPEGVAAQGHDAAGLRYALATLNQIVMQTAGTALPCVEIADWPQFPVRYHHDDVSRRQISTMADFQRILQHLADYKFTHYTLYMEDTLHLATHPQVGEGRGKLMPDEVAELHAMAERVGVEIFPTFSLLGHYENILRLPRYAHLAADVAQMPSSLNPLNPAVRPFLQEVIADVCALFPSKYFHMGFDETQGVEPQDFLDHANWCAEQLVSHGKTPLMWIDMIYNHFGMEQLDEMHPAIIPVVWGYRGPEVAEKHSRYFAQAQEKRTTWGLAGYNNWCRFFPETPDTLPNIEEWMKIVETGGGDAIGCSQWGDDGYENHRDLPWHLFAGFAEYAWAGAQGADPATLPERFMATFYGAVLEPLQPLLAAEKPLLNVGSKELWSWHRLNHWALQRIMHRRPELADRVRQDIEVIEVILGDLDGAEELVARESGHLQHWRSGLLRARSVLGRLLFAEETRGAANEPWTEKQREMSRAVVRDLEEARAVYAASWLQNNRPENMETSLRVFDERIRGYAKHAEQLELAAQPVDGRFHVIDLDAHFNIPSKGDGDFLPAKNCVYDGVPYRFPGLDKVGLKLAPGQVLELAVPPMGVVDMHLVAMCSLPADRVPKPTLRLELLRGGVVVWEEELRSVTHLCDWFDAHRDRNIWAGGGLRFVDPTRVSVLETVHMLSVLKVGRFPLVGRIGVDAVRLTNLAGDGAPQAVVQAFTIEGFGES